MSRKKILWLCSWYPNKLEPFNGDFVQRQAYAASLFNDIHVIHIAGDASGRIKAKEDVFQTGKNITEHIVYYPRAASMIGKLRGHFQYRLLFREAVMKYIQENGKPDLVHVQVTIKAGLAALWIKNKFGIPYVLTEHAGIYNRVVQDPYEERSFYFRYNTRRIIRGAGKFLPVSRQIGEAINRLVIKKPFTVVPNTVDTSSFTYIPPRQGKFRFIHVSNMIPLKNVEGIINAVKILWQQRQDFELQITGAISPVVSRHARSSGLLDKAFYFTGEVPYKKVAEEIKSAHAMILFSRTENMPCVLLESLCCGRPVIASRVGGVPEIVHPGNGILVESGNEDDLVNAMQQVMDNYTSYNQREIANKAIDLYSYEAIGKEMDKVYTF